MKKRSLSLVLLLCFVLLMTVASMAAEQQQYLPEVKKFTYPNGLTLLVVERHDSPTIATMRYHKVGSFNEYPGATGSAHLLEHMMFKGTKNLGTWNYEAEKPIMDQIEKLMDEIEQEQAKSLTGYQKPDKEKIDRLWKQVQDLQKQQRQYIRKDEVHTLYEMQGSNGLNAYTSFDETGYIAEIPSNKLEVWAYMESERIRDPIFREFYSERDVVNEERRMRSNTASGAMFEAMLSTAFTTMPYGHEIVGWPSDIMTVRRDEVMKFLTKYYAPNNTILVLIGDIDSQKAYETVGKYFNSIPRQEDPRPLFTQDPPRKGERRAIVKFKAEPQIRIVFKGPKPGEQDQYALDVLGIILGNGRTSRFHENIEKKDIAYYASSGLWVLAHDTIFVVAASPRKDVTTPQMEEAIYKEIERLKTEPVAEWELEKARNITDRAFITNVESKEYLSIYLAKFEAWTGDWRNFDDRAKVRAVTAEDIMRVAKKYLSEDNRAVVTLVPDKETK